MSALLLRLAGPLSSYGSASSFHHRRGTHPHPTRSALIGMFAAAQGRPRLRALAPHHDLPDEPSYHDLTFTIRIDRPGTLLTDFHTVGGGLPHGEGLRMSKGGYRSAARSTLVTRRDYLADAVFTVAVQGPEPLVERIATTLEHPVWAPYLGRRCCIPDEPLLLAASVPDPVTALRAAVPLCLTAPPPPGAATTPVDFIWEQQPDTTVACRHYELPHSPIDFTPGQRTYTTYSVWSTTEPLPTDLYAGPQPLHTLTAYRHAHHHTDRTPDHLLDQEPPCRPPSSTPAP
ncbi:type I-E CRISPR-associated protein Cas5/CasD [Streptomyces cocklensis]|uniref:Type I-E CRISPR-associated protein Cas5/CasD n=1 Tax=Actinacidiphila cocklensis TaxID=887465 RepID=A0A9W4GQR3_9ACTN|nr:type I-E CRISPR-associated protein Cas5/CasD [Actinacidiphila cocklensis]MDD1064241.1 type I-E CRISPR-associated protein Cas5/CasD [Actinacidiphila cocklensis]CAG6391826.1 Type I-E CRISPR-associated protein Cas5/CasD [Actinacidiphila cocklensis]